MSGIPPNVYAWYKYAAMKTGRAHREEEGFKRQQREQERERTHWQMEQAAWAEAYARACEITERDDTAREERWAKEMEKSIRRIETDPQYAERIRRRALGEQVEILERMVKSCKDPEECRALEGMIGEGRSYRVKAKEERQRKRTRISVGWIGGIGTIVWMYFLGAFKGLQEGTLDREGRSLLFLWLAVAALFLTWGITGMARRNE